MGGESKGLPCRPWMVYVCLDSSRGSNPVRPRTNSSPLFSLVAVCVSVCVCIGADTRGGAPQRTGSGYRVSVVHVGRHESNHDRGPGVTSYCVVGPTRPSQDRAPRGWDGLLFPSSDSTSLRRLVNRSRGSSQPQPWETTTQRPEDSTVSCLIPPSPLPSGPSTRGRATGFQCRTSPLSSLSHHSPVFLYYYSRQHLLWESHPVHRTLLDKDRRRSSVPSLKTIDSRMIYDPRRCVD